MFNVRALLPLLLVLSFNAFGFEIYALGTSNTNCKNAGQTYTKTLNELFKQEGIDATVINGGVDGDRPVWMMNRLTSNVNNNTKIVIFEPGPNDRNKTSNVEESEKILSYLKQHNMPTVFVSNSIIWSKEEADQMAAKYNAYYYGHWAKNIPKDTTHRQFDIGSEGGHATSEGCKLWATYMFPLLKQVMKEQNIH
jgi:hypothetical protein